MKCSGIAVEDHYTLCIAPPIRNGSSLCRGRNHVKPLIIITVDNYELGRRAAVTVSVGIVDELDGQHGVAK